MCHLVNYVCICIQCTSNAVELRPEVQLYFSSVWMKIMYFKVATFIAAGKDMLTFLRTPDIITITMIRECMLS